MLGIPEELPKLPTNLPSSAKKITTLPVYYEEHFEEHLYKFLRDEKHIKIINEG